MAAAVFKNNKHRASRYHALDVACHGRCSLRVCAAGVLATL
jgi:hypothetical protein